MDPKNDKIFDLSFILLVISISILGAIIGMQLITTLGITANTSIIGALFAMVIARIPLAFFNKYKSIHTQNMVQTSVSSATFAAGNSLFIPIGIPLVMGRPDLIVPMFIGVAIALIIDAIVLYRVFDSKIFPASGTWPPGVATAESIKAGDQGGRKAKFLGFGIAGGMAGSWLGIPMSAFGVAFIGNIWALSMFGIGLLISGYSIILFATDINNLYIPHGIMIGAGLVALFQFINILVKDRKENHQKDSDDTARHGQVDNQKLNASESTDSDRVHDVTTKSNDVLRAFGIGYVAFVVGALILAILGGLMTDLSIGMLILFVTYAGFTALATQMIVGVAAMHSGWFPAFAVSLIALVVGMLLGFPPMALALLVGYTAATGPAFADLGYDLKAGHLLRGEGKNLRFELQGRRQQLKASFIGLGVAIFMVYMFHDSYFAQELVAPVNHVYASTIEAGVSSSVAWQLLIWMIPGALIQFLGGTSRQIGILFATGLLLADIMAGFAVLAGIVIRIAILRWKGKGAESTMFTTAAGFIAGDALYNFFSSILKTR